MRKALFSNHQKTQVHFYRAHACFVKYFLMTKKLQQTKKLAYVTTCGLSGLTGPVQYSQNADRPVGGSRATLS